jgi:hypothetical protein
MAVSLNDLQMAVFLKNWKSFVSIKIGSNTMMNLLGKIVYIFIGYGTRDKTVGRKIYRKIIAGIWINKIRSGRISEKYLMSDRNSYVALRRAASTIVARIFYFKEMDMKITSVRKIADGWKSLHGNNYVDMGRAASKKVARIFNFKEVDMNVINGRRKVDGGEGLGREACPYVKFHVEWIGVTKTGVSGTESPKIRKVWSAGRSARPGWRVQSTDKNGWPHRSLERRLADINKQK